tara:strand:+ start:3269 stop:3487 length:219 start_codon:yes stop_codon:yes gene_type:complete
MSLLKKLQTEGSSLSQYDGQNPESTIPGGTPDSILHNAYSVNGTPGLPGMPTPSELDINGETPSKYTDSLPE